MRLVIDFETRSACNLKTAGPAKYAAHPTTQVICLGVKVDDEPARLWWAPWVPHFTPGEPSFKIWINHPESSSHFVGTPEDLALDGCLCEVGPALLGTEAEYNRLNPLIDDELRSFVQQADLIEAHNFEFERAIWHQLMVAKYAFPPLDLARCSCTAARAAVHGLPRKLEDACNVLGLHVRKDMLGHALMMKLCKPRTARKDEDPNVLHWREDPEEFRRLGAYCLDDVEAEAALSKALRPLSASEQEVWRVDQEINARGVCVDLPAVRSIIETLYTHEDGLLAEMVELTDGRVASPRQVASLRDWLAARGVPTENLQKGTVNDLLANGVMPEVRRVLEIRQALGRASTGKFTAMAQRADADHRCRSLFLYNGAGTGRWGGKAIQPQNLPRDSYSGQMLDVTLDLFKDHNIEGLALLIDEPFAAASRCVRGVLTAGPGKDLVCADYSSIEARANAWLAGQDDVVEEFRAGRDLYKVEAAGTFGCGYEEVSKAQRQVGKVEILSLGYGGGIAAFAAMAGNYGIDLETLPALVFPGANSDEREQALRTAAGFLQRNPAAMSTDAAMACDIIKQKWRAKNTRIVRFWAALGEAASSAVESPGKVFSYRKVSFRTWKDPVGNNYLVCRLPSGRYLYYFGPKIRAMKTPWGDLKDVLTYHGVDGVTRRWVIQKAPGFLLCENIVQAACRDLLADAMVRVEAAGYPVVLHVHDELVSEVDEDFGSLEAYEKLMAASPEWARGLPVQAVGWRGKRYRKE